MGVYYSEATLAGASVLHLTQAIAVSCSTGDPPERRADLIDELRSRCRHCGLRLLAGHAWDGKKCLFDSTNYEPIEVP